MLLKSEMILSKTQAKKRISITKAPPHVDNAGVGVTQPNFSFTDFSQYTTIAETLVTCYIWYFVWQVLPQFKCSESFNPVHANFFRRNKSIYLHFMSFLHADMTQVP